MFKNPFIIKGGVHIDKRGTLKFVNDFSLEHIKRFYIIHCNKRIIRAWQGHKKEFKYFYPIKGEFKIYTVKIDEWLDPSENLEAEEFILTEKNNEVLVVPAGYANGIFAMQNDSILLVFSNLNIEEAKNDLFRFDQNLWVDWENKIKELI
ncbi:hypothetical protein Calab_0565 [Caldithrix abyssi DSM 13497]|uniref:dTDP-4-dehydrorhamnose 3,5-epimerase n=1 Tax=Caldithrix abyssi DSM 13497 TaxID=880073 RepID=H1XS44_CALAY|nr:WxcM-like domain-containing protein [Caldithrix abyssi]APF20147.1 dTDP-4-dehydrorhamnose 3,5-epimerase [Caldithrix abyssi DSM 13497]EHO40208.1 hypothetical protein Calab_0565 [Caldithrix abyssi DSM 13497]